jgi:flagellar hook-associated protein 3 FlgL
MRITNNLMAKNFLRNLEAGMTRYDEIQNQMSTGKKVRRPSDDPVALDQSLRIRRGMNSIEQYTKNQNDAMSWLKQADTALGEVTGLIQRASQLAVQGTTGTEGNSERQAIAQEIHQIREAAVQIGNTSINGRYIFAGTNVTARPFADSGAYVGNSSAVKFEINQGVEADVSIPGSTLFPDTADKGPNALTILDDLAKALESGDEVGTQAGIGELERALDHVLSKRSEIGSRTNRIESNQDLLLDKKENLSALLKDTESVDMAEVIMNLKVQETMYRTALEAGARILQPSLLDFLR